MQIKLVALVAAAAALTATSASAAAFGQAQFTDNCAACHQANGKGIPGAFPPLAGAPIAARPAPFMLAVVLHGRAAMPAFKDDLDDAAIAAAVTYARTAWGNKGGPVTPAQVKAARKGPPPPKTKQAY